MTWALTHRDIQLPVRFSASPLFERSLSRSGCVLFCLCFAVSLVGCSKKETKKAPQPAATSPAPAPSAPPPEGSEPFRLKGEVIPQGPRMIVVPGIGVSAIRLGTNLETLARHMEAPCDIQTETRCVYINQAMEFSLKDGVVSGIKIHRRDRRVQGAPGEKYYGAFNGVMPPSIMLGLHRHVVIEEFGEPLSREPLQGTDGQVELHKYEGVNLEYDVIDNGNTVLSAIELVFLPAGTPKKKPDSLEKSPQKQPSPAPPASVPASSPTRQ